MAGLDDLLNLGSKGLWATNPTLAAIYDGIRIIYKVYSNYKGDISKDRIKKFKEQDLSKRKLYAIAKENSVSDATEVYARKLRSEDVYTISLTYGHNGEPFPPDKNIFVGIISASLDIDIYDLFDDDEMIVFQIPCRKQKVSITDIEKKVKQIIVEKLEVDEAEVIEEASFVNDLGADELDLVELVMQFEKEFDISIPDDVWEKLTMVGDVINYLDKELIIDQARRVTL